MFRIHVLLLITWTLCFPAQGLTQTNDAKSDTLRAGYMYWAFGNTFLHPPDLVLYGKVLSTDTLGYTWEDVPIKHIPGLLLVDTLLYKSKKGQPYYHQETYLWADCFNGLHPGDELIVALVIYDGGLGIIPYENNTCRLGYQINAVNPAGSSSSLHLADFAAALSATNPWDIANVSADQIAFWATYDPSGFLYGLIMQKTQDERHAEQFEPAEDPPPQELLDRVSLIQANKELDSLIEITYAENIQMANNQSDLHLKERLQRSDTLFRDLMACYADILILKTGGHLQMDARRELALIQKKARLQSLRQLLLILADLNP